jgi:hypothetical protein
MVNSCAVCGCCTRTDIGREHLEDTRRICDVSAKGLLPPKIIKLSAAIFCRRRNFVSLMMLHCLLNSINSSKYERMMLVMLL